ncbi:transglutaminase family protein [Planktothrix sp. FACHB-1355]|uniref:Transglutaminase family protein n=1 Tax=Aerosakkonema funiforme FACHB-1375 TaxID=2949571 RepID=A0A926ZJP3_9CYAN|nr:MULTISPECIES: transglutaminase family protein [Oscillatoriales]MBD2185225.1 transglutaminase family protein [Aerosakkonema funiforme FACHB-1375]MBD3561382.1 transglutaminase family protein [Planktothrix sp. FACHB-1355]
MKFYLGCLLRYTINTPSTLVFNIHVVNSNYQRISHEKLNLQPGVKFEEYIAPVSGNRYVRVNAPVGTLEVNYEATVELSDFSADPNTIPEVTIADLPMETLQYLYPSRYCQSDRLMGLVQSEFGELEPGYSRVSAICDWIYNKVTYISGSSNSETSAYDTAMQRTGVCRDFAHLGVAFCRALNIPARFVSAYAYGLNPPDFHACFEAYLGDRWYLFDATRLVPLNSIIRIGKGLDAADVAFATLFGSVQMAEMKLFVEPSQVEQLDKASTEAMAIAIS